MVARLMGEGQAMTCNNCARADRAAILYAAIHGWITDEQHTHLYNLTKENNMYGTYPHHHITPTLGDIGIEEEEWEVLPTETPAEVPTEAPSEPVPA